MVMAKQQHGKGLPKQARNEPAPPAPQPAPFRFEQCWRRDDANRQADDGSTNGAAGPAGPLHLTLGPLGPAAADLAPAPAAPATVAVLRGSRYLRPAQELLGEVVRVADLAAGEDEDEDQAAERLEGGGGTHRSVRAAAGNEGDGVEAKLLGLLSELESRRERYFGELGRVVSSFEPALGDGAAAAYTSLMARAMARHFGNLRRAILRRLRLHAAASARRSLTLRRGGAEDRDDDDEAEVTEELVERVARRTKLAAAARSEQASWRPLRGLPDGSVAVLRAWLFDHFLHPYPDDGEKLRLAVITGLSRRQISNWFINARVRLWKPMIEEMYKDEFSEGSAVSRDDAAAIASSSS